MICIVFFMITYCRANFSSIYAHSQTFSIHVCKTCAILRLKLHKSNKNAKKQGTMVKRMLNKQT